MNQIDHNHNQKKKLLKILGITILTIGLLLTVSGMFSFFQAFSDPGPSIDTPKVGSMFIGMPLIFLGIVFTALGFMGEVARYQASEMAPVGKDVINYMVDGTKDSIETVARSIHNGISDNKNQVVFCTKCHHENNQESNFCQKCGDKLNTSKTCSMCQAKNDVDAKFCDNCGTRL